MFSQGLPFRIPDLFQQFVKPVHTSLYQCSKSGEEEKEGEEERTVEEQRREEGRREKSGEKRRKKRKRATETMKR